MKNKLQNKIALIIGGTSELGKAICKQLALSGARIATDYQDKAIAKAMQLELKQEGISLDIYPADLTNFSSITELVSTIENDIGAIDIVINNLDYNDETNFSVMDKAQWDSLMKHNLDPVFGICKQVIEGMSSRGFGRIVNISSIISRMGKDGQSHYAASKAGMHGVTMALAQELARDGVTVNTVSPGLIATSDVTQLSEEQQKSLVGQIPAARLGEPDEVAYIIDFLCSDKASFITGTDIAVNGGQYMH